MINLKKAILKKIEIPNYQLIKIINKNFNL